MTDPLGQDSALRELDEAHRARARFYWHAFDELRAELGAERAEAILGRAAERLGEAAGRRLFAGLARPTPQSVADAFLAASPGGGRIFPHRVARSEDGSVAIAVTRCPMQDAWRDSGIADGDIATLCRVAGRFDHGCFGAARVRLAAETWRAGREGCCRLRLSPR